VTGGRSGCFGVAALGVFLGCWARQFGGLTSHFLLVPKIRRNLLLDGDVLKLALLSIRPLSQFQ